MPAATATARRRTRTTALLTAAALSLGPLTLLGATTPAHADDTPGFSVRHISVDTTVGPDGDHPCTVTADLYRPDGASPTSRVPSILTTHGFGGSKDDERQRAYARGFAREGYAVLTYSGLGFGGSECKIHLDDPEWDGKAGSQLVDVLAGTRAYTDEQTGRTGHVRYVSEESPGDPRVGMLGVSYGGEIQYAVAGQDRRVDAIIPIITWNDLSYSLAPNNTDLAHGVTYRTPGVHKRIWTDLFFGLGILDGLDDPQVDPARDAGCPNFTDQACASVATLETLGYPDAATLALARHASVSSYAGRIHVPTLLVQGQRDTLFNLQEATATFRALRRQGTPVRMVWRAGGHSGPNAPGEFSTSPADPLRASYLGRRYLHWMDHYVRGDDSAPVGPRFAYFRDWVDYDTSPAKAGHAIKRAYATRRQFSQEPTARLFFSGHGSLVRHHRQVRRGSASYANASAVPTSYSETSGLEGNQVNNPPSDTEGTFAAFTSPPLRRRADVVGSPRLRLHLQAPVAAASQASGPAGKLIVFAKVYDVAPDGTQTLKNRLIAPVRVRDVTEPVHVQLPGVVQRFERGHRIRVVLAASDFAYANNPAPEPVTVTTSRLAPSVLRLPLTGPLRLRR